MAKNPGKTSSGNVTPAETKVGRGNPPLHTRFRKGESGNRKGRPPGRKNLNTVVQDAAHAQVTVTTGGRLRKISKLQATAIQLATKAANGDQAAMGKLFDLMDKFEARAAANRRPEFPASDADLEVIREVHKRMLLCELPEGEN